MKKVFLLALIMLLVCSGIYSAEAFKDICIGPGYNYTTMYSMAYGSSRVSQQGPAISMMNISRSADSNVTTVKDFHCSFPLSYTSAGITYPRSSFNMLMSVDLTVTAGYTIEYGRVPLRTTFAGGLDFMFISRTGNSNLTGTSYIIGLGFIADLQYFFTEKVFLNVALKEVVSFLNISYGSSLQSGACLGVSSYASVGIGKEF